MLEAGAPKRAWRDWAKAEREKHITADLSRAVCNQIEKADLYKQASHILSYLAFGSELELSGLHESSHKTFYVTRTWMKPEPRLSIHKLSDGLEQHPYGYWQPKAGTPELAPDLIDLVLVPGLAFDKSGTRLGYGMGFYDRLLPQLSKGIPLVGVTTEPLLVSQLPLESFDIAMTHLVTEKGFRSL